MRFHSKRSLLRLYILSFPNMFALTGLIAAPFTPMKPDGNLNLTRIPQYAEMLMRNRVAGVFVCGSTGEGVSLDFDEKKSVIQSWAGFTELKRIALVGGVSLAESKALAKYANECHYDAIAFMPPYFFKPSSIESLGQCCAEVAATTPNLPFYFYHIPVLTNVYFSMLPLLEWAKIHIPNFAGIKFTEENLMDFAQCLNFQDKRYNLLWGRDEVLLAALAMGATGGVGSTYNYAAPLYHAMIEAFHSGDMETARIKQQKAIEIVRLLGKYGGIATGKAFMRAIGIDCGDFRLPIRNMSKEVESAFLQDLEAIDFFSECCR